MTTPPSLTTQDAEELVGLAEKIRDWQQARKLSDNELLRRMPSLGSTKTFTRILKADLEELDLLRWVTDYRSVWAVIESLKGRDQGKVEIYDDLSTVVAVRRALVAIFEVTTIRRVVFVEADSGLGKTTSIACMQEKWGQRIISVEACDAWDDNPNAFLGAILDAQGIRDHALSRDGRLRQVTKRFNQARTALAIDEAHHLGPHCLNTVKTLVNQTPGEFCLLSLPTLWRRLERGSYEEVRQLLGNRLAERIKILELLAADVRKLLLRRVGHDDPRTISALIEKAAILTKQTKPHGNYSFVDAVCERALEQEAKEVTHEVMLTAMAAELARR